MDRFRTFFTTFMSSENLLVNWLALNAHFCNSLMTVNRKYADMLAVEKQDMTEEESSHAALLSSLIKIRAVPNGQFPISMGMKSGQWLNSYVLLDTYSKCFMLYVCCIAFNKQQGWLIQLCIFVCSCILCVFLYETNVSELTGELNWIELDE